MSDIPTPHSPTPPVRAIPAAELVSLPFDDTRVMDDAMAPLVGDLPVWRRDGRVSLPCR